MSHVEPMRMFMKKCFVYILFCFSLIFASSLNTLHAHPTKTSSLAPMLKRVTPSIVSITGIKKIKTLPPQQYSMRQQPQEQVSTLIGSGVIVEGDKGYILTNAHVVEELDELTVILHDQNKFPAKVIGQDKASDLALLKVETNNKLPAIKFADSDAIEVGDFVVAIGSPYGFRQTVTSGIVSAIGRNDMGFDGYYDFIQTDADINMGNSGGGLLNLKGELIGINTVIISTLEGGGGSIGLGFAIPSNMAHGIFLQLAHHGHVDRGPLGVGVQPLTPNLAQAFMTNTSHGAIINEVYPNTPAAEKLKIGDVLLQINNKPIKGPLHLRTLISLIPPGSKVNVKLARKGKLISTNLLLKNPKDNYTKGEEIFSGLTGMYLENFEDEQLEGIRIVEIIKGSAASNLDLQVDDIIVSATLKPVLTPSIKALKQAANSSKEEKALLLQVVRDNYTFFTAAIAMNH